MTAPSSLSQPSLLSQSLLSLLRRDCPQAVVLMESCLKFLSEVDSIRELDFERDPETSFNPRPCRIPTIMAISGSERSAAGYLAAVLSCVMNPLDLAKASSFEISENLTTLADEVCRFTSAIYRGGTLILEKGDENTLLIQHIFISQLIDRFRHLHLATSIIEIPIRHLTEIALKNIPNNHNSYREIILLWNKRYNQSQLPKTIHDNSK